MREINKIAEGLFEKIRDRFEDVSLGDDKAMATQDPEKARFFNFDYVVDGHNHGNVTLSLIDEISLKVYFSKNITKDLSDHERQHWYDFLRSLREFARRNLLSFEPRDITRSTLKFRDIRQVSKADDTYDKDDVVKESRMYGTTRSSYENRGPVRIIIRHADHVDPERVGDRSRKIKSIYLETQEGERFKLPHNSLRYARAMSRHLREGGTINDDFGQHITEMAAECAKLRNFKTAMSRRVFEDEETQHMVEAAFEYHGLLKNTLNRMSGRKGYQRCQEQFVATSTSYIPEEDFDAEEFKERFVKRTYNERIQDALPLVHKAYRMKKTDKFVEAFEGWADRLSEGTWQIPEADSDIAQLVELLAEPLPVGADAENAINSLSDLIGDDVLYDDLADLAKVNPEEDARNVIIAWLQTNLPEVYDKLEQSPEEDRPSTHNQEPMAENEKPVANMSRNEILDLLNMDPMRAKNYSNEQLRRLADKRTGEMTENYEQDDLDGSPYEMGYRAAALHHKSKSSNPFDMSDPRYDTWEDGWREGAAEEGLDELDESGAYGSYGDIHESHDASEAVQAAIIHRIINQHKDVLAKFGPTAIMNAVEDEAAHKGDIEEIGTSDVSAWTRSVIQSLETGQYGDAHNDLEEDYGQRAPADSASPLTHAHQAWCDACDREEKKCVCEDKLEESFMSDWNSFLSEGKMKDLAIDLRELSEAEFKKKYGKTKAEMRASLKEDLDEGQEEDDVAAARAARAKLDKPAVFRKQEKFLPSKDKDWMVTPDELKAAEELPSREFALRKKELGMKEEVDTGEVDARKTTPSSEEEKEKVFSKHRERVKNLEKDELEEDIVDIKKLAGLK